MDRVRRRRDRIEDEVTLTFEGVYDLQVSAQVLLDYRDLSERGYSSTLVLTEVGGDWRFYDVHLFTDTAVTGLGDAVYPQPGLRDVRPKPKPGLRARLTAARSAFRSP